MTKKQKLALSEYCEYLSQSINQDRLEIDRLRNSKYLLEYEPDSVLEIDSLIDDYKKDLEISEAELNMLENVMAYLQGFEMAIPHFKNGVRIYE